MTTGNATTAAGNPCKNYAVKDTQLCKAQLGVDFLALVKTNRFKYWAEETEFDDA